MPASLPANASERRRVSRAYHRQPGYTDPEFPLFKMRWILLLLALASAAHSQDTCLTGDYEPYVLFGTKTAYTFVNRQITNLKPQDIPGCEPIAIWLLIRHGSHNPEAEEIEELQKLVNLRDSVVKNYKEHLRNSEPRICPADITLLSRWTWNSRHNQTFAGDLTTSGYMQTQQLGQGWRDRYHGLFTNNQYDYVFKYATDKRSSESFRAFTEGLFGAQAESKDVPKDHDEKLLMPYKSCPAWTRDVENNNDTYQQRNIFESKREFGDMVSNISRRLGFNYDIDRNIIQRMYQMCRYNKAWLNQEISPWCAAFSREDLRRFEYAEDLETYNKYGYGLSSQLNAKLGCVQVQDFMNFFRKHVDQEGPQQPRVSVQFVEAPMMMMVLSALGARRDPVPLTGDNYHTSPAQSRRWTNSAMVPFNANLAAVLYKCNPNGNFGVKDRYQVLFLQNEQTMNLQNCRTGLCEWSYVKDTFGGVADKCNLDVCNGAPSLRAALSVGLLVFIVISVM